MNVEQQGKSGRTYLDEVRKDRYFITVSNEFTQASIIKKLCEEDEDTDESFLNVPLDNIVPKKTGGIWTPGMWFPKRKSRNSYNVKSLSEFFKSGLNERIFEIETKWKYEEYYPYCYTFRLIKEFENWREDEIRALFLMEYMKDAAKRLGRTPKSAFAGMLGIMRMGITAKWINSICFAFQKAFYSEHEPESTYCNSFNGPCDELDDSAARGYRRYERERQAELLLKYLDN